jgi:DNA modification methylase
MREIPDGSVDMILADIPYGEVSQKSSGLRVLDRHKADRCDIDLPDMVAECCRVAKGSIYIFCGIGQISPIDVLLRKKGLTTRLCQWQKSNPSPMNGKRLWLSGSEFCVFARKPKAVFNRHCEKPIWVYPVGRGKLHPTQKPVALCEYIIESSTNTGETVLDFTMGSGTTGVACVNTDRDFTGIEMDAGYFEIAKNRINEAYTLREK